MKRDWNIGTATQIPSSHVVIQIRRVPVLCRIFTDESVPQMICYAEWEKSLLLEFISTVNENRVVSKHSSHSQIFTHSTVEK